MSGSSIQLEINKNWKTYFIHYFITFLVEHSYINNVINALLCVCSCFYVQVFEVNYFLDFPEFVLDRGVGGYAVSFPNLFGLLYIFFNLQGP